jgi:hypothetical protein
MEKRRNQYVLTIILYLKHFIIYIPKQVDDMYL